jgi:hypothetical protein
VGAFEKHLRGLRGGADCGAGRCRGTPAGGRIATGARQVRRQSGDDEAEAALGRVCFANMPANVRINHTDVEFNVGTKPWHDVADWSVPETTSQLVIATSRLRRQTVSLGCRSRKVGLGKTKSRSRWSRRATARTYGGGARLVFVRTPVRW